jgi:hypothetical protein
MIDPGTGTLSFQQPALRIGRGTTRAEVLATPWGAAAARGAAGGRGANVSWKLEGRFTSGAVSFGVLLRFERKRLAAVDLWDADPSFGASWDDFSHERELLRKASHDRWLDACLGDRRSFPWGSARADYDPRGGGNGITVEYNRPPGPLASILKALTAHWSR